MMNVNSRREFKNNLIYRFCSRSTKQCQNKRDYTSFPCGGSLRNCTLSERCVCQDNTPNKAYCKSQFEFVECNFEKFVNVSFITFLK
jgi:hypothetical protein